MPTFIDLLLAYGLCFGLQNKVEFLRSDKWFAGGFFSRMLDCSYCTGFHTGWLAWLLTRPIHGFEASVSSVAQPLAWAFVASAFCYLVDAASQMIERAFLDKQD